MSRDRRSQIARETLEILELGLLHTPDGADHDITEALARSHAGTVVYAPERELPPISGTAATRVEVTPESTLAAARRLVAAGGREPAVLSFASAKNPGGGFRDGAQAQEESLARSSGLYTCLLAGEAFYRENRASGSAFYTDHLIYSPGVPVFRDDHGQLIAPYHVAFLTIPAVNAWAVLKQEPRRAGEIAGVMARRVDRLLAVAAAHGHRRLVLGAWGCGVFGNQPSMVAQLFATALFGAWSGVFAEVVFAIYDPGGDGAILRAFEGALKR